MSPRGAWDSPEKVPLVPESPEGLGFIKVSMRGQPQVVPGEIQVGKQENSFLERAGKLWKRLPRAGAGDSSPSLGGSASPADVTLGDTWGKSAGSEPFPTQALQDATLMCHHPERCPLACRDSHAALGWSGMGTVRMAMAPACARQREQTAPFWAWLHAA